MPEKRESESNYIFADRYNGFDKIYDALQNDLSIFSDDLRADKIIYRFDLDFLYLASLDMHVGVHIAGWDAGDQVAPIDRRMHRTAFKSVYGWEDELHTSNSEFLSTEGMSRVIGLLGDMAVRDISSRFYPRGWKANYLEAWMRFGSALAYQPIYEDILTRSKPPSNMIDYKIALQAMDRLAICSELLGKINDHIQGSGDYLSRHVIKVKRSEHLLSEYDGILFFTEDVPSAPNPGEATRVIPAPINMDIGPKNAEKGDIFIMNFGRDGFRGGFIVDYKSHEKSIRCKGAHSVPFMHASSESVGAYSVRNGVLVKGRGELCRQYIEDRASAGSVGSEDQRFIEALSILGIDLGYVEAALEDDLIGAKVVRPIP